SERQQRAALLHQRRGAAREIGERVAGDLEAPEEILALGIDIAAPELARIGEADGVDGEVEPPPALVDGGKEAIEALFVGDIAIAHEVAADLLGERPHALAIGIALIRESEFRAMRRDQLGDAPGERALIGNAHDQAALSLHERLGFRHAPQTLRPQHSSQAGDPTRWARGPEGAGLWR